jgi:tetratricopeptide (TPR) repeat protein
LGALGGIIAGVPLPINIVFIIIGIFGSLYSLSRSNAKEKEIDDILEVQATLLSNAGLGNIYVKAFEAELRKTGSCKKASKILTKALEINPNDKDAMLYLSTVNALNLSFQQWVGDKKSARYEQIFSNTKMLAEKGIGLFPKEHRFHDVLGIILDIEGKHDEARKEFLRSSKFRTDPYWRKLLSTSWLMSEKSDKAVNEIEKAINEGADPKIIDLYYGRALCANGDYKKGERYLLSALKSRGWRPELLSHLEVCYSMQAKLFRSLKYGALKGFVILITGRLRGFFLLVKSLLALHIPLFCALSKAIWPIFRKAPRFWRFMFFLPRPEQPEFSISTELIRRGHYNAAENLLRKVCEIRSDKGDYFSNLAVCLALQGCQKEAIAVINRALELQPEDEKFKHNKREFELGLPDKCGLFVAE